MMYPENENDWANNLEGNPIHISQAESGAKGYYCMGCDKAMQAVKRKIAGYQSYFRHHVKDVDNSKVECVHASRQYREKLAFFYFMRTKQITVPAVYKYPPKGVEGLAMLLKEKQTIIAHKVESEVAFFEDENGKIHRGKNADLTNRFLLIRPDAVFFDKEDRPILFIEFVVTHTPDTNKLNKLQRLGINTVQIIVPKKLEEEIEKAISKVSNVKWTYNEIESNAEYISIPQGKTEGIPSIDEDQRKLFEESFKCRATQVGNLIRTITSCLESQPYRKTERLFEQEIQRIEKATGEHKSRLVEIQEGFEGEISSEFRERRKELESRRGKFQYHETNVESRYLKRREEIRVEQNDTDREVEFRSRVGNTEEGIRAEFEFEEANIEFEETNVEFEEGNIESEETDIEDETKQTKRLIKSESDFKRNFESRKNQITEDFKRLEDEEFKSFEKLRGELESKIDRYRDFKAEMEGAVRSEFEGRYDEVVERVYKRDIHRGDELSERIKSILDLRGLFDSYRNGKSTIEKYRKGIQFIKNGTWKE